MHLSSPTFIDMTVVLRTSSKNIWFGMFTAWLISEHHFFWKELQTSSHLLVTLICISIYWASKEIVVKSFHNHTFPIIFLPQTENMCQSFSYLPPFYGFTTILQLIQRRREKIRNQFEEEIRISGIAYFFHMIEKRVSSLKLGHF